MDRTDRTHNRRASLFWRVWFRSLTVKRPQALLAAGSILVGAAIASMLLNLYGDVRRKVTQEFRSFGANVVLAPPASSAELFSDRATLMDEDVLGKIKELSSETSDISAVPMLYVVARVTPSSGSGSRLEESSNAVLVGTNWSELRRLYSGWRVAGPDGDLDRDSGATKAAGPKAGPALRPSCVIGAGVSQRLRLGIGGQLRIETEPNVAADVGSSSYAICRVRNLVSTGSSEDDQVFLPLSTVQRLTGLEGKISLAELSVTGPTSEIAQKVQELSRTLHHLDVRPIRPIVSSEGKVLGTVQWLLLVLTALILLIIAHCVMATMTAIVLERRKDIGVMKALGATDRLVMGLFLSEGASMGLVGGVSGFLVGGLLARGIGRQLFGLSLNWIWWTLPVVSVLAVGLAVGATIFPVRFVRGIEPAVVLKGE